MRRRASRAAKILMIDLGHGNVELGAQTAGQAFDDVALRLQ